MIGLDTNVLARYYVQDESDTEAARQHEAARRIIESGEPLMVAKSVLLELEWVMRGYYGFPADQIAAAMRHLASLPQVVIEQREAVERAISDSLSGLDFADALHLASYQDCAKVASFDDRKFARRARRLKLTPPVVIPT